MSTFPDDLSPTDQDPDPDSPEAGSTDHTVWRTKDQHHFDHNIADDRWADIVTESQPLCAALADKMVKYLSPETTAKLDISVLWTDDQHIAALNSQFRQKSGPTNILSFPSGEPVSWQTEQLFLGDLVLGYETITTEADEAGTALTHHVAHLLLHGLLHLAGYDHIDDDEAAEMEALETNLLAELGIADPYAEPSLSDGSTAPDGSLQK